MVWLVINQDASLQGSMDEGMAALEATLHHRRGLGCTIDPDEPPQYGVQYTVKHPGNGFELIYLSAEVPEPQD